MGEWLVKITVGSGKKIKTISNGRGLSLVSDAKFVNSLIESNGGVTNMEYAIIGIIIVVVLVTSMVISKNQRKMHLML